MIFKKDKFLFGCVLGFLSPAVGMTIFKYYKLEGVSFKEAFNFMVHSSDGHRLLSAALSVSLLLNLLLLTLYLNMKKDNTAKGIFASTVFYALIVLLLKTFG